MVASALVIEDCALAQVVAFHGHLCPGLAMGIQAAAIALREVGAHADDEEIVAVVETDMCSVDAIQFLTGCTFGKGNLVHLDWGKNAYTFYRRADGHAVRIAGRPDAWGQDADQIVLSAKVRSTDSSEREELTFTSLKEAQSRHILEATPDSLFTVKAVTSEPPHHARILSSVPCAWCDEATMETRIHLFTGQPLCPPCFERALADN
jgi:formylmethanofuran dehydrogenase subunit E